MICEGFHVVGPGAKTPNAPGPPIWRGGGRQPDQTRTVALLTRNSPVMPFMVLEVR